MAFKFGASKSDNKVAAFNNISPKPEKPNNDNNLTVFPKLTNSQLNKLTKGLPGWLKDNNNYPKQLPGIYQGVLGQVQLQPNFVYADDVTNGNSKPASTAKGGFLNLRTTNNNNNNQLDYMNRFTDTERVQQLLSTSQLSNDTLAAIWAHVNKTFPGKLTNREVCLALALIALFQRKQSAIIAADKNIDPFIQIKLEKKPPVPILQHHQNNLNSKSTVNGDKETNYLLVDLQENGRNSPIKSVDSGQSGLQPTSKAKSSEDLMNLNTPKKGLFSSGPGGRAQRLNNCVSLIDMDGLRLEDSLCNLSEIWLKCLKSIKATFKRSFDILNVENSRQSAIEALKSKQGGMFSKHLSLCYPMAHNIRYKVMELNNLEITSHDDSKQAKDELFDKSFTMQIDDLMTSINEYWAVLINLFHESGQTKFIEFIMDGLNYKIKNGDSRSWDELAEELSVLKSKTDTCSICLTKFYLVNECASTSGLSDQDISLLADNKHLISRDNYYYYHARCANFWVNNVVNSTEVANFADNNNTLPFQKPSDDNILSPLSANLSQLL